MPRLELPDESEIRALVGRVVDGMEQRASRPTPQPTPVEQSDQAPGSIAVGADHGGFRLKERIMFRLREQGHTVVDCGTDSAEAVDYPDLALAVAERVASGECQWGVIVDGAGIGSAMVANKVPGVRAALCYDVSSARNSREHNHANVVTLGAGLIGEQLAMQIVDAWLATPWGEGRHARRVRLIDDVDVKYSRRQS